MIVRLISFLLCLLLYVIPTFAQQPQQSRPEAKIEVDKRESVTPSPEQSKVLAQAFNTVRLKEAELEALRAQFRALVFETMARLKLNPDEYTIAEDEKVGIIFVKIQPPQPAKDKPEKKPGSPSDQE